MADKQFLLTNPNNSPPQPQSCRRIFLPMGSPWESSSPVSVNKIPITAMNTLIYNLFLADSLPGQNRAPGTFSDGFEYTPGNSHIIFIAAAQFNAHTVRSMPLPDHLIVLAPDRWLTAGHSHRGSFPHPTTRQPTSEELTFLSTDAGKTFAPLSILAYDPFLVLCEASMKSGSMPSAWMERPLGV